MNISEIKNDGSIRLDVEGRLDSSNSTEFQEKLLKAYMVTDTVIVNMEEVSQISSAALRALMLGKKTAEAKGGTLLIINAGTSIREVFRVTGFDKLIDIR